MRKLCRETARERLRLRRVQHTMDVFRDAFRRGIRYIWVVVKWLLIAGVTGGICGLVGTAFYLAVTLVTELRMEKAWLLYILPVGGAAIALLYKATKMEGKGTNAVIDSIHRGDRVPILLVPVIFVSTVITHLFGGSAGREGAALQIGGGIGCQIGRICRLDEKDMRLVTLCGMSAVFAALFGTPLTAAVFALEVISVGIVHYAGLLPCLVASLVAYGISLLFGAVPTQFAVTAELLAPGMLLRVAALAVVCAVVSIAFCELMHFAEHASARLVKNTVLRAAVGGVLVIGVTLLLGTRDYNGAGGDVITAAIQQGEGAGLAFFWKMLLTALTIGFGFKGGEIVPTFFIGATLGCAVGPLLGVPAGFAAAIGLVAMFCGVVNCPIASILLSIELFGSEGVLYFALACGIAYMLSGYFGLYSSQKIVYSKIRAEFIDRYTEK